MQTDYELKVDGTLEEVITETVVSRRVLDPFNFDAQVKNLEIEIAEQEAIKVRADKAILDKQAALDALKAKKLAVMAKFPNLLAEATAPV